MRRLRLTLSDDGKELAELNYREQARTISDQHRSRIQQLQSSVRSGGVRAAVDREYLAMARETAEAWVNAYLISFIEESLIPTEGDISEMGFRIEEIVESFYRTQFYIPLPSSVEAFRILPYQIHGRLKERRRIMELESRRQRLAPLAQAGNQVNIHGPNYGLIQQGGEGNTQSTNRSDDETKS